jgi:predicted TIM-barrel fold metal-dependent hydrolase
MEANPLPTAAAQKIDVHCHLFNKKIASIPLLLDAIKSIVEPGKQPTHENELGVSWEEIKRIGRLLKLLFSNDEDALLGYLSKYESVAVFVPLMFDLKLAVDSAEAVETLKEMKAGLHDRLRRGASESSALLRLENDADEFAELSGFEALLNTVEEIIAEKENASKNLLAVSLRDTFDEQYQQLIELKNKHAAAVAIKPFFAVDARRGDVYERMKTAIEKDGFSGVKMYCPNGYSPVDPRLDKVYRYCLDNHIPITAHCSYGGFATLENEVDVQGAIYADNRVTPYEGKLKFTKKITQHGGVEERALALNHPDLWNVVLNKYGGLKLNLAHLGIRGVDNPDERYEWSNLIIKMMLEHENLYTDLSCMTDKKAIADLWELASKADKQCRLNLSITDRVMFGTDFWLSMMFKDLNLYMEDFNAFFADKQEDFTRLQQINPSRFLNL